jgi:hypothetical protein
MSAAMDSASSGRDARGRNCYGTFPNEIAGVCNNVATARRAELITDLPAGAPASAVAGVTVTGSFVVTVTERDAEHMRTQWKCRLAIANFPNQTRGAFPVCGCAERAAQTCHRFQGTTVTLPGLVRPADAGVPTYPGDTRVFNGAPVLDLR